MKIYRLNRKQLLSTDIHTAWKFFTDPENLPKITPGYLKFKMTNRMDSEIYSGMLLYLKIKPVLSLPMKWVTEITQVYEPVWFVDEQRKGPYGMWRHKHIFKEADGGVQMEDIVDYAMPFGVLGRFVHFLVVAKKLEGIFDYRRKALDKIFNSGKEEK
jgi:ligand-binding SRPBCC domain-containing protein